MVHDINTRFVRARSPEYTPEKVEAVIDELERERGVHRGLAYEGLLKLPDPRFFRRKGEPAFQMVGIDGEAFTDADTYLRYLSQHLNDGYVASRDMRLYAETLRQVVTGTLTPEQGVKAMPKLKRLGADGRPYEEYPAFETAFPSDTGVSVRVRVRGKELPVRVWVTERYGHVPLYLLEPLLREDRWITHRLYEAGTDIRIAQEMLL